jgi:nitroreductase
VTAKVGIAAHMLKYDPMNKVNDNSIIEIIQGRFSCRRYIERAIDGKRRQQLHDYMISLGDAPFGTPVRFAIVAATEQDRSALRWLGTYGFIHGASGFIVGAVKRAPNDLEDYGYMMERLILFATSLELGTCWLGGTFTKSSFSRKIEPQDDEWMPAVASIGYMADPEQSRLTLLRRTIGSDHRIPLERLFFNQRFGFPLTRQEAGMYATPLEMVRLGPSASNKQPWRIVKEGNAFHFYLQRTRGYRESLVFRLLNLADLQRIDLGIAMCHFELSAKELDLPGAWSIQQTGIIRSNPLTEYTVSWIGT